LTKYKVNTDEHFYNKFTYLKTSLRELSCIFQNEGVTINDNERSMWICFFNDLIMAMEDLKSEAINRIEKVKPDPKLWLVVGAKEDQAIRYMYNTIARTDDEVSMGFNTRTYANEIHCLDSNLKIIAKSTKAILKGYKCDRLYLDKNISIELYENLRDAMQCAKEIRYF